MLLAYQTFYKKFGIRVLPQLITPHMFDLQWLEFPQESIYHYISYDGSVSGPPNDEYVLRNIRHQIPVYHISELQGFEGNPRHSPMNVNTVIKDYHHSHHHTKQLRVLDMALRDKNTPIVFNYSLLGKLFRYQQSVYAYYYRWKNIFETVISNIAKTTEECHHQHFLFVHSPKVLPSLSQMNSASTNMTQSLLHVFGDDDSLLLLELWKWLTDQRANSAFNKIPANKYHLVNILFREAGQWFVLNLGILNSWRMPLEGEEAAYASCVYQAKQRLDGTQIAKRLLKLYMTVMELRTLTAKAPEPIVADNQLSDGSEVVGEDDIVDPLAVDEEGEPIEVVTPTKVSNKDLDQTVSDTNKLLATLAPVDKYDDLEDLDHDEFVELIRQEDQILEQELMQLNEIAETRSKSANKPKSEVKQVIEAHETNEHEKHIETLCDKLASDGVISPGEHNRFIRLASSYKNILSPDGINTLDKFSVIEPESLKVVQDKPMADAATVIDKSMLHSTLNEFDSKYVEKVLHKDYVNTALSIQRAGVAVTNYKVIPSEDILGAYEELGLARQGAVDGQGLLGGALELLLELFES